MSPLREEFEMETGAHRFADQDYIKWLENLVEKLRAAEEIMYTQFCRFSPIS